MAVRNMFRVKWTCGLLVLISVLLIGACGGSESPDSTSSSTDGAVGVDEGLDQVIELYDDMLDLLAEVTDEASAEAAADDLVRIANQVEDLEMRMAEYSQEEFTSAALWSRFLDTRQEFGSEFDRILSANPAAFELLSEAFENLN